MCFCLVFFFFFLFFFFFSLYQKSRFLSHKGDPSKEKDFADVWGERGELTKREAKEEEKCMPIKDSATHKEERRKKTEQRNETK